MELVHGRTGNTNWIEEVIRRKIIVLYKFNPNHAIGNIAFDDAMQAQSSPVFVATLIVGADSYGVACEYQAFFVEKRLADKILTRDSYGVRRTL